MVDVDDSSFTREVVEASRSVPVLVDFWAPWCGPCRTLGPMLEKLEREAEGRWKLVKVNTEDHPRLASTFQVRSIPYVVAFVDGQPVDQFVGAMPERELRAFLARLAPPPGRSELAQAREHLAAGRTAEAIPLLRAALALDPSLQDARLALVDALLASGHPDDAQQAFEPLRKAAPDDLALAARALRLEACEAVGGSAGEAALRAEVAAAAPGDGAPRWRLAQLLIAQARWADAVDALLDLVRADRKYGADAGRRGLLAVFELCGDDALVRESRRRLAAALN